LEGPRPDEDEDEAPTRKKLPCMQSLLGGAMVTEYQGVRSREVAAERSRVELSTVSDLTNSIVNIVHLYPPQMLIIPTTRLELRYKASYVSCHSLLYADHNPRPSPSHCSSATAAHICSRWMRDQVQTRLCTGGARRQFSVIE
jgi:hypothetical protein